MSAARPVDLAETVDELDDIFGRIVPIASARRTDDDELPLPTRAIDAPAPQPIRWVVRDLFTAGDIGLIVGDGGSFKSSAAIHLAAAVAGGMPAFDRFATERAPVLFCSAEDPGSVIQMRLEAFVRGHGWNREAVLSEFHYLALAGITLTEGRWKRHLLECAESVMPSLIILDPFVDLSGVQKEQDNSETSAVMKYARQLARHTRAAVVFVHHANKSTEAKGQARIRGASAIANASRGTLFLEFTDAGVLVEQLKMTYAPKLEPFMIVREIESQPANRGDWITARLTTSNPRDVRLNRAHEFVLGQIAAQPRSLTTTDLKKLGGPVGVRGEEISGALRTLHGLHRIDYEGGPRGARLWFVLGSFDVAQRSGQGGETTLPTLPKASRARSNEAATDLAPPIGGQGASSVGQLAHDDQGWQPDDSQADAVDS
jgi:hypothetical protein